MSLKFSELLTGLPLQQGIVPLVGYDLLTCEYLSGIKTKLPSLFFITLVILLSVVV